MRLGISFSLPHSSPTEWAEKNRELGLGAVVFPVDHTCSDTIIDAYASAAKAYDLTIAEVGAWKNLLSPNSAEKEANYQYVLHQLELADHLGANCCVDISGACGDVWDGGYAENYSQETFEKVVTTTKKLIAQAKVKRTFFTLEPMPWMLPWDGESYLALKRAIDSPYFGVHMDAINLMNSPDRYFHCADFLRDLFSMLHGQIKSVHVKDVALQRSLTLHLKEVPVGQGGFDIATYAILSEKEGADTPFILEHLAKEDEYLSGISYLKAVLKDEQIPLK